MPITVEPSSLSLNDVHRLLKLQEEPIGSFTDFLTLNSLTEFEQEDLLKIRNDFWRYLAAGKISEGLVKFLTIAPLMRSAGFYDVPIRLTMEDVIAIAIEDEDIQFRYSLLSRYCWMFCKIWRKYSITSSLISWSSSIVLSRPTSSNDLIPCAKSFLVSLTTKRFCPFLVLEQSVQCEKPYLSAMSLITLASTLPEKIFSRSNVAVIMSIEI
jgi:hypothetical protein